MAKIISPSDSKKSTSKTHNDNPWSRVEEILMGIADGVSSIKRGMEAGGSGGGTGGGNTYFDNPDVRASQEAREIKAEERAVRRDALEEKRLIQQEKHQAKQDKWHDHVLERYERQQKIAAYAMEHGDRRDTFGGRAYAAARDQLPQSTRSALGSTAISALTGGLINPVVADMLGLNKLGKTAVRGGMNLAGRLFKHKSSKDDGEDDADTNTKGGKNGKTSTKKGRVASAVADKTGVQTIRRLDSIIGLMKGKKTDAVPQEQKGFSLLKFLGTIITGAVNFIKSAFGWLKGLFGGGAGLGSVGRMLPALGGGGVGLKGLAAIAAIAAIGGGMWNLNKNFKDGVDGVVPNTITAGEHDKGLFQSVANTRTSMLDKGWQFLFGKNEEQMEIKAKEERVIALFEEHLAKNPYATPEDMIENIDGLTREDFNKIVRKAGGIGPIAKFAEKLNAQNVLSTVRDNKVALKGLSHSEIEDFVVNDLSRRGIAFDNSNAISLGLDFDRIYGTTLEALGLWPTHRSGNLSAAAVKRVGDADRQAAALGIEGFGTKIGDLEKIDAALAAPSAQLRGLSVDGTMRTVETSIPPLFDKGDGERKFNLDLTNTLKNAIVESNSQLSKDIKQMLYEIAALNVPQVSREGSDGGSFTGNYAGMTIMK